MLTWLRQLPLVYAAAIGSGDAGTRLEWVVDSDFRFFPTMPDELFGYVLHPADLAMNKVMAAAGRREVRDLVDLVTVHEAILPLGAVIWAAVEKAPGFTPEGLIAEIRRNAAYPLSEWRALHTTEPLDPAAVTAKLREKLWPEAEVFVAKMLTEKAGLLFLKGSQVVQPDPISGWKTMRNPRRTAAGPLARQRRKSPRQCSRVIRTLRPGKFARMVPSTHCARRNFQPTIAAMKTLLLTAAALYSLRNLHSDRRGARPRRLHRRPGGRRAHCRSRPLRKMPHRRVHRPHRRSR